mmetsp:Transcript_17644/g.52295  ORF Transcript_17644/g.52295 Transcript_17644/m.52295 type:complete len:112 (+) Transcript_17644:208-543(+)
MSLLVPQTFWDRLSLLHDSLATGECWNDVDSIAVPIDPPSEDAAFTKSSAFFIHLFGLELHDSLAMLCKGALHVLATDEKCAMLKAHTTHNCLENLGLGSARITTNQHMQY